MVISNHKTENGFALLLTLIVISVVLAIGLSMMHITMKQLSLSNIARDSEVAIHAARTGIECMQYHRGLAGMLDNLLGRDGSTAAPLLQCAGTSPLTRESYTPAPDVYNYKYSYNVGSSMCVETSMYLLDASARSATMNINITSRNEGLTSLRCTAGAVCTTIFSRGFNRSCNNLNSFLTVQRELTIRF